MELFDEDKEPLPKQNEETIEWLKQFKYTRRLQEFVAHHKFGIEELVFLRCHWKLTPKKQKDPGVIKKWS